jgi:hypothetical protein
MCGCIAYDICLGFDDTARKTRAGQIMHQRLANQKARELHGCNGKLVTQETPYDFSVHVAACSTALISLNALLDFFVNL